MNRVWCGTGFVELTGADDGLSHRVTESAYRQALAAGAGRYRTVCGRTVPAASMITAPGRSCRTCRDTARTGTPSSHA